MSYTFWLLLFPTCLLAAADTEFFEKRIRPILAQECYECHATATQQKGGLVLDHREGLLKGGDTGPALVPGAPEKSLLLASIRHEHRDLKMPKNGGMLEARVLADFSQWIAEGAADPRDSPPSKEQVAAESAWPAVLERRKQWWSFLPLTPVTAPAEGHPVDAFLHEAQAKAGLTSAPAADPTTLLRRVSYVLTGLPPEPSLQKRFLAGELTYAAVVDQLLASPRYGEKWARHWLDWVRYAETYGSEGDPAIPYAWRYRDYVIRAWNQDVPYPQLIREALAGDLLEKPRHRDGVNESALGIGQLRLVLHGFSPTDTLDELVTFTDNQIDVVSKAFLGTTLSCARCHNHKFDALSQADFYSWYGIFTSTRPAVIDANLPSQDTAIHEQLQQIKTQLRSMLAEEWLKALPPETAPAKPRPALAKEAILQSWTFADSAAGEFSVAAEGESILRGIYPSGNFSHLLTTKRRSVLHTPNFTCAGGTLWVRCAGDDGARVRYIVQNYPRTGTIHKAIEFDPAKKKEDPKPAPDSGTLTWKKLDLNYWKGDQLYLEATTAADRPVETKLEEDSWYGITQAIITKEDTQPPEPERSTDARAAVLAWQTGKLTDAQAELLHHLLQSGKLPNQLSTLPTAASLVQRYRSIAKTLPAPTRAPGVVEGQVADAALFTRGDHKQPSHTVPRHFLDAHSAKPYTSKQSGRLELAESIAHSDMTARVMANRLWHHTFGSGIVRSTDNFGRLGDLPSHPALLDWLATELRKEKGQFKPMLRLLVTSSAFASGTERSAEVQEKDPENRLLTHWTVRRLEAEAIRDSLLHLSGKLELKMEGKSVDRAEPRRSIYTRVIRNDLDPLLTAFDLPVPTTTRGNRDSTQVPAQSLTLLNDPLVQRWVTDWITTSKMTAPREQASQLLRSAYSREPTSSEIDQALTFAESQGWPRLGSALVNAKEFIYLR